MACALGIKHFKNRLSRVIVQGIRSLWDCLPGSVSIGISSLSFLKCVCVCVVELHLILCDPMDCSQPDSSVHGISQVRRQPVGVCCVAQGAQTGAL